MKTILFATLVFMTGSARDVKVFTKALHAWTVGPAPCVQFVEAPQAGALTLKVRWQHSYRYVATAVTGKMDLYDDKGSMVWSNTTRKWNANGIGGAITGSARPELEMYPLLWEALGCGQATEFSKHFTVSR